MTKGVKNLQVDNQIVEQMDESEGTSFVTEIHTESQLTSIKSKRGSHADASNPALEKIKTSQLRLETIGQESNRNSEESD